MSMRLKKKEFKAWLAKQTSVTAKALKEAYSDIVETPEQYEKRYLENEKESILRSYETEVAKYLKNCIKKDKTEDGVKRLHPYTDENNIKTYTEWETMPEIHRQFSNEHLIKTTKGSQYSFNKKNQKNPIINGQISMFEQMDVKVFMEKVR